MGRKPLGEKKKNSIFFWATPALRERIEEHRDRHRIRTLSVTVASLVEAGLKRSDEGVSTSEAIERIYHRIFEVTGGDEDLASSVRDTLVVATRNREQQEAASEDHS